MIKVIATICNLTTGECMDKVVATSDMLMECQMAMPKLAAFMEDYPNYRLAKWTCEMGDRRKI